MVDPRRGVAHQHHAALYGGQGSKYAIAKCDSFPRRQRVSATHDSSNNCSECVLHVLGSCASPYLEQLFRYSGSSLGCSTGWIVPASCADVRILLTRSRCLAFRSLFFVAFTSSSSGNISFRETMVSLEEFPTATNSECVSEPFSACSSRSFVSC